MPLDGKVLDVVATTDRARFAADLARHANEPYGERGHPRKCALGIFLGGPDGVFFPVGKMSQRGGFDNAGWPNQFAMRYDRLPRQPTGFDCLAILQSIP